MKKRLHDRKRLLQFALSLSLILMSNYTSWGQQVIGSFPTMDGGFENQAVAALPVVTIASTNTSAVWTMTGTSATTCKSDTPRTGGKYVQFSNTQANRRLNSPTAAADAVVPGSTYTFQYYYRTGATAPNTTMSSAVFYSDLNLIAQTWTSTSVPTYTIYNPVFAANVPWTKISVTITAPLGGSATTKYGFFSPFRAGNGGTIDIDDAVMYAGAEDVTAPADPSGGAAASILATQQTISWTAASGGVDGGGYMVVRGLVDPTTAPKLNGIYAVGNFVAGTEKVVYLGATPSFIDTGLAANTQYFYRIYTVDKAFNYSSALTFNSTTAAEATLEPEPTVQASGLSFSNVTGTGLDISWTAGDGSKSLVVVKATSNVDSDPIDGGIYVPSSTFGGGTQIGSGNYVVYNGTGNSASITGLSLNTIYYVKVYSFNVNAPGSENYLITSPASGNQRALPYQNTFNFDSTTEGFTTLTRAVAVQATESLRGTLKINSPAANRNSTIVGLNTSYARVNVTTNKYAHITLKNTTTTNNNIQLVSSAVTFNPRQIITTNDADYKTYDFDLSALTGDQYPTIYISVKDTWSGTATYAANETVIQSNGTYINLTGENNALLVPRLDPTNWAIVGTEGGLLDVTNFIYIDSIVFDNVLPTLVSNGTGGGAWGIGTTWAGGIVPGVNDNVNIVGSDAVDSTGTRNCNQLSIAVGSSLTVAGGSLTVKNGIINNGTITVDNNANLIQTAALDTNSGSGTATVKRNSNPLLRSDYTLWSSPVTGQNLLAFSPATTTTRFYNYNTATNFYNAEATPEATPFTVGKGYLIRMPNTDLLTDYDAGTATLVYPGVFTGVPNNGTITVPITAGAVGLRYNLVGNPYPSPITMSTFVSENASNIESTLYFWRKTNGVPTTSGSAYCTWIAGTFTGNALSIVDPLGVIQTGQGFFVEAKLGASTLTFNNTQRVSNTANQFFRTKQVAEPSKIWLNATNAAGNFSQMAVTYFDGATLGVDAFDAKYINDSDYALTSSINGAEYTIQGRPAFDVSDVVALNFKTTVAGNYTIAIDHVDGLFSTGQTIFLKDNLLNSVVDLSAGSYTFASAIGTFNSRFEVVYQSTLAVTNPTFTANSVIAFSANGEIRINSGSTIMERVRVYDLQGRLLVEKKQINASETKLSTTATNQVLLVEITAANGIKITKKIIQ